MLNAKQRAFTVEYMKDKNATQAAIRAGYSEKTAYSMGCRLLKNAKITEAVEELQKAAAARAGITVEKIADNLQAIATDEATAPRDKIRAYELLGKYLGMFTERVEMKGQLDTTVSKLDGILKQLEE